MRMRFLKLDLLGARVPQGPEQPAHATVPTRTASEHDCVEQRCHKQDPENAEGVATRISISLGNIAFPPLEPTANAAYPLDTEGAEGADDRPPVRAALRHLQTSSRKTRNLVRAGTIRPMCEDFGRRSLVKRNQLICSATCAVKCPEVGRTMILLRAFAADAVNAEFPGNCIPWKV